MSNSRKNLNLVVLTALIAIILFALFVPRASAQDGDGSGPGAPDITATSTAVADEAPEPPAEPETPPATSGDLIVVTWQGMAALIALVLGSGVTIGLGGALVIVRATRQNETIKYAMERLYLSTPPETQRVTRDLVKLFVEGGELLDEVTDGVINIPASG